MPIGRVDKSEFDGEQMEIETKRLKIRNIVPADKDAFSKMASDGSLYDVGFDKNCSSWMEDWILEAQSLAQKDNPRIDYLAYVIEDKRTRFPIGSVGCSYYADMGKIGITYFVGAEYRNKGYASEAVKAYVKYFFEHYDEMEMIATIREDNISSWKVIEKAGFVLADKQMYKDMNDINEEMYRFYFTLRE